MLWPIISLMNTISSVFYSIYLEVNNWIWPFNKAAGLFYSISSFFASLGWAFSDFDTWVMNIANQLSTFISWNNLTAWFTEWAVMITDAWNWVKNWGSNVLSKINSWWSATATTVHSWIDAAVQGFNTLKAQWDNFWNTILPNLMTIGQWYLLWPLKLLEITGLIDSAFFTRQDFWSGWQEVRDNVIGFITKPLDFLLDKFTDWFLGKE
jgi:hypothetical protein